MREKKSRGGGRERDNFALDFRSRFRKSNLILFHFREMFQSIQQMWMALDGSLKELSR